MYGGVSYEVPMRTGKKVHGLLARQEPTFSLGWDQSSQLNSYQLKRNRGKEITGKITTHLQDDPKSQPLLEEPLPPGHLQQLYEKLAQENPDVPPEELQRYIMEQEQQRRSEQQKRVPPPSQAYEKRAPIYQKESMKDIIFGGSTTNNDPRSMEEIRAASRRNRSNMVLGDNYEHYPERKE